MRLEGTIPISASTGGDYRTFAPEAAANVPNNSVFHDSADTIIKLKDNGGTVRTLY